MQKIFIIIKHTMLIFCISGCISEYKQTGAAEMSGILVVDGMILDKGTIIRLSRTINLNEMFSDGKMEDVQAGVYVMNEWDQVVAIAEKQIINGKINPGVYVVKQDISFDPAMKYALYIVDNINEKTYKSEFVYPVFTPKIDEVGWNLNGDNSIDIFVSSHDPANKINYYMWDFDETWEIRSKLFSDLRYDPVTQTQIQQSLSGDNRYYCWSSDYSKSILVASSSKYSDAVIKNHKIHTIQPGNSRYSYLYSIFVRQYGLEREAYLYFENMRKNLEESGGIFGRQPTELPGNIKCLTNPEEPVIGYISVALVKSYQIFIPMAQLLITYNLEDQHDCNASSMQFQSLQHAFNNGFGLYYNQFVRLECIDCTRRGGTKNKPENWPNDHR